MTLYGIRIPLVVTKAGKFEETTDSKYLDQLIMLALSDCESENPFQTLGFPTEVLFDSSNASNIAKIQAIVTDAFDGFKEDGVAELIELKFIQQDYGTLVSEIVYRNLFNGDEVTVNQIFSA